MNIFNKIKVIFLCVILVISSWPNVIIANETEDVQNNIRVSNYDIQTTTSSALKVSNNVIQGHGFKVEFIVTDQWKENYNGQLIITNTQSEPLENWGLKFSLNGEITNIWGAKIESKDGNTYIIKNLEYNQDIGVGQSLIVGFSATYIETITAPCNFQWIGEKVKANNQDYSVAYKVLDEWGEGFNGEISITNNSSKTIEDWQLEFDFKGEIIQFWTAEIIEHVGNHYVIKNRGYNANIEMKQTLVLGFTAESNESRSVLDNFQLVNYKNVTNLTSPSEPIQNVIFSSSKGSDSTVINAKKSNIYGNIWANGEVNLVQGEVNVSGVCQAVEGIKNKTTINNIGKIISPIEHLEMPNLEEYSPYVLDTEKQCYSGSEDVEQESCLVDKDILGFESMTFKNDEMTMNASIMSINDILIDSNVLHSNSNAIKYILSANGNIIINADDLCLECVLFAPNGKVEIIGKNIQIAGKIFANKIAISGENIDIIDKKVSKDSNDVTLDSENVEINYIYPDCNLHVTRDIILPTIGERGTTILWESDHPELVSGDGNVNRPYDHSVNVELTATITKGTSSVSKTFNIKVIRRTVVNDIKDNTYEDIKQLNEGTMPEIVGANEEDTPVFIMGKYSDILVECPEDAIKSLNSIKSILNLDNAEDEFIWEQTTDFDGDKSYRLQQVYHGIEVCGNEAVIGTTADGEITSLYSTYSPEIRYAEVGTSPQIGNASISQYINDLYSENVTMNEPKLAVYSYDVSPRLAWRVTVVNADEEEEPIWDTVFIDAMNGRLLSSQSELRYASGTKDVNGTGTIRGKETFKAHVKIGILGRETIELVHKEYNISVQSDEGKQISTSEGDFNSPSYSDAVDAYLNLIDVYEGFDEAFSGWKGMDGKRGKIVARINYEEDNATWKKKFIEFGKGTETYNSWASSLDLVAHEYTHGFIYYRTNGKKIGGTGVAGAIEEAYCDTIGGIIQTSVSGQEAWWYIGDNHYKDGHMYRRADDPTLSDPRCAMEVGGKYYCNPTIVTAPNDSGGVHANSTIFSHIFYEICDKGMCREDLLRILNRSLEYYNSEKKMTFDTCRYKVKFAAQEVCRNKYGKSMAKKYDQIIDNAFLAAGIYRDVKATDWFCDDIYEAVSRGYIKGYGNGRIMPEAKMKVSEFIAILSRVYCKSDTYGFKWLKNEIKSDSFITREEAAYIIWRSYVTENDSPLHLKVYTENEDSLYYGWKNNVFCDQSNISDADYEIALRQLYANKIICGEIYSTSDDIQLNPKGELTRAVCCAMIMKALR